MRRAPRAPRHPVAAAAGSPSARAWMLAAALGALLGALLGTSAGCSVERGESPWPAQSATDAAGDELGGPTNDLGLGGGPGAGTMTGTWLQVHERSTCILNQEQVSVADYLVTIEQSGDALRERRTLCNLELSPVLGIEVAVPRATLESIETVEVDSGLISSLRVDGAYTSATEVGLWGLELDAPLTDPLPVDADDPAVVDADDDGHPAVTFLVGDGCERYASQRQIVRYHGTLVAPNRIEGGSVSVAQTEVYDASESLCTLAPPLEPNDLHNRFRMIRIDGRGGSLDADQNEDGAISCDEIRALAPRLLAAREPDRRNCR